MLTQGTSFPSIVRRRYSLASKSQKHSRWVFFFVLIVHLGIIFIAVTSDFRAYREAETAIILVQTHIKSVVVQSSIVVSPIKREVRSFAIVLPELTFSEDDFALGFGDDSSVDTYEFPHKKSDRYNDVFNPELRKRLQELTGRKMPKPKIQYIGVGITLEDIGDGKCIYGDAFHKSGAVVKCGPDQGEIMMENVEKSLADPLGLK